MISPVGRILLKVFELLGCVACVVTKALTDLESGRVFLRNQKLSREWGLLHNLFWSPSGNAFANVTYGGFTLIIALMLISRIIDAKSRPSLVEKIFLTVGMLCFFTMGGLVFAAFDQVPNDLHDNAIVLGCLSFFVALLILIDLADPMARHTSDTTQTDNIITNNNNSGNNNGPIASHNYNGHVTSHNSNGQITSHNSNGQITSPNSISPLKLPNGGIEAKQMNGMNGALKPTETSIQVHDVHEDSRSENHSPQSNVNIALNGNYHRSDEVDFVQTKILPRAEQPVFEKVLLPEKRRPEKQNVPNPRQNTSQTEFVTERVIDPRQTSYDQRQTTAYDQRQLTAYDEKHLNDYDQKQSTSNGAKLSNAYDQRQETYNQATTDENHSTAYDHKQSTAYDHKQSTAYDHKHTNAYDHKQSNAYDQRQSPYNQRRSSYNQRQSPYNQNNFSHEDQYFNNESRHNPHQNYGYVRDNIHATRKVPLNQQFPHERYDNRPLMVIRDYSNARANMSYDQRINSASYRRNNNFNNIVIKKSHCRSHCSSDDDENVSAVQPGFVANATKIWDSRAKRDFNTVV